MLAKWGVLLLGCSLSACANSGGQPGHAMISSSPAPISFEEAKAVVLRERGRIWKDPYSIQDARIGQPYTCTGGLSHVANMPNACICVEANARNSFGGYTGLKRSEVLLNGSQIVDVIEGAREATYSCGAMTPFPELSSQQPLSQASPPAKRR